MNRFLPVQGRRCATAGLMLVIVIVIFGTGPFWITTAALILATIFTAVLWKAPEPRVQEIEPQKNLKDL
jgi:ABC-type Fe3+-siderophore transport system permease subunit